ncbi:EamA family transporter [uncultured Akkermansia sp.]|uniref:EamA family transporter n=1 Tax=uncultured Akkermansia sp. TaxID=512294 RepID=UPI002637D9E0|nr:EamA family transporter [uncultured Akkermansia sp.]
MSALLITSFIWALSFGLLGNCLSGLPASFVAMARMAGSLAVFLPFVRRVPFSHALGMMGIGAVQFGGMYLCYIAAFHYLPSHQVALFTATTPIYVVLAAMGGAGILWKGYSAGNGVFTGIVLVQLSNLCFAAGQIAYISLKNSRFGRSEASCFAYAYAGALLVTLPSGLPSGLACWQGISAVQWWLLAYLGIIASGVCFFLWNYGARRVTPVKLAVMNNLKIPLAALTSLLLFREHPNMFLLFIGCLLILSSFLIAPSPFKKTAQE